MILKSIYAFFVWVAKFIWAVLTFIVIERFYTIIFVGMIWFGLYQVELKKPIQDVYFIMLIVMAVMCAKEEFEIMIKKQTK